MRRTHYRETVQKILPWLRAVGGNDKCTAFKLTAERFGKYAAPYTGVNGTEWV